MSAAVAEFPSRFVRKTTLSENEYRVNFKQIDNDVIMALVSPEARKVTPQMPAIYLSLLLTPHNCWERDGVIHFVGEDREEGHLTAWEQMREITRVANSTLSKALDWMHKNGIIGYDAHANGVGVRIFFNRASSSIRSRKPQKNLLVSPTPTVAAPTPSVGMGFKGRGHEIDSDSYKIRAAARHNGSFFSEGGMPVPDNQQGTAASFSKGTPVPDNGRIRAGGDSRATTTPVFQSRAIQPTVLHKGLIAALAKQFAAEFQPEIATAIKRESVRLREWFMDHGVPKATRVAQRETYNLLRSHGIISTKKSSSANVGTYKELPERGREGKSEDVEIASFIAATGSAIREKAADLRSSGRDTLASACVIASRELSDLNSRITSGARVVAGEIEEQLTTIDAGITESLWGATAKAEREMMLKSARADLESYATHMERESFEELVRKRVIATLREQHGIPCLSLFYL